MYEKRTVKSLPRSGRLVGVGELAYPVDPQSYAGGSLRAPGRCNQAGQVCVGEGSDAIPVPQLLVFIVGLQPSQPLRVTSGLYYQYHKGKQSSQTLAGNWSRKGCLENLLWG